MGMDDEVLIEQDGRWYKQIPAEEAFRIRCDVPLYLGPNGSLDKDYEKYVLLLETDHPSNDLRSDWWQGYPYYIEVDSPTKEEYTL